jgi:hypothetical protein
LTIGESEYPFLPRRIFFLCSARRSRPFMPVCQRQQDNLTLEVVESLGVFSKYHGFVLIVDDLCVREFQ